MGRTKGKTLTIESHVLSVGKSGMQFYTDKSDKHITAIASYYYKKVATERLIAVQVGKTPLKAKYITKVTIL